jgi:ketosteroid isomerase-like protein
VAATGLEVIRRMVERTNAHDLEGMAALMDEDYQSEQPFHPARGFGGRAQMKANWGAILTGVPDLRAEVPASVQDGDVVWSEWHWWGTTEQGEPFDLRAITQFTVRDGLVVRGRLFAEVVEQGGADINDAVEASPATAHSWMSEPAQRSRAPGQAFTTARQEPRPYRHRF